MALALLARTWAAARRGDARALVVDHGLRLESAAEAALTSRRLAGLGIAADILKLEGLAKGPGLAARARAARYAALHAQCVAEGRLHLLLGHHAADQAETVALRMVGRSGADGLAGMAGLIERAAVRLLRPLLTVPPERLRATLAAACVGWVEDPSNRDPAAQRNRLRILRRDGAGSGPVTRAAVAAAAMRAGERRMAEAGRAAWMAQRVAMYPEGYAVLAHGPIDPAAFADLLRTIAGRTLPVSREQANSWAAAPRAATLAGCDLRAAGRRAPSGWLVLREAAAMAPPVAAVPGVVWDGRYRLAGPAPQGSMLGPLGEAAKGFRDASDLPSAVLRTLPALRSGGTLVAVPHLGYAANRDASRARLILQPAHPAAGSGFVGGAAQEFG